MKVYDLRGLSLSDPLRKEAYPESPPTKPKVGYKHLFEPVQYLHLVSTRWYFDASDSDNAAAAEEVIADLCFRAETEGTKEYRPLHVVVDNYGGTVVGERRDV